MNNPYEPPTPQSQFDPHFDRRPFVIAAIGAWLAAAYWLVMTALLGLGMAAGKIGGSQIILPLVLIAMYAHRGYRLFRADAAMVRSIIVLHVLGMVAAVLQINATKNDVIFTMNAVKIGIHIFGVVGALLAKRAIKAAS